MKIVDAIWGGRVNTLIIECECGFRIKHPANRWRMKCEQCHTKGHLKNIRESEMPRSWPLKEMKKNPEWDFDVNGAVSADPVLSTNAVILAVDPANSTGWCVFDGEQWHHGQCDIDHLAAWIMPLIRDRPVFVLVERGYINPIKDSMTEARKVQSERNQMKFFERCGRVVEFVNQYLVLAGPVWRPTSGQWRETIGWKRPPKTKKYESFHERRKYNKRQACYRARLLTGDYFTKQAWWYENGTKRFKPGTLLDDEADAVCQAEAGRRRIAAGEWPGWEHIT